MNNNEFELLPLLLGAIARKYKGTRGCISLIVELFVLGVGIFVLSRILFDLLGEQAATPLVIGASGLLLVYFGIRFSRSLQSKEEEITTTFVEANDEQPGEESSAEPLFLAQDSALETATSVELDNEQAEGKEERLPVAQLAIIGWIAGVVVILLLLFNNSGLSYSQFTLKFNMWREVLLFGSPGVVVGGLVGGFVGRRIGHGQLSQQVGAAIGGVIGTIPFVCMMAM